MKNTNTIKIGRVLFEALWILEVEPCPEVCSDARRGFVAAMFLAPRRGCSHVLTLDRPALDYLRADNGPLLSYCELWEEAMHECGTSEASSRARYLLRQTERMLASVRDLCERLDMRARLDARGGA